VNIILLIGRFYLSELFPVFTQIGIKRMDAAMSHWPQSPDSCLYPVTPSYWKMDWTRRMKNRKLSSVKVDDPLDPSLKSSFQRTKDVPNDTRLLG